MYIQDLITNCLKCKNFRASIWISRQNKGVIDGLFKNIYQKCLFTNMVHRAKYSTVMGRCNILFLNNSILSIRIFSESCRGEKYHEILVDDDIYFQLSHPMWEYGLIPYKSFNITENNEARCDTCTIFKPRHIGIGEMLIELL